MYHVGDSLLVAERVKFSIFNVVNCCTDSFQLSNKYQKPLFQFCPGNMWFTRAKWSYLLAFMSAFSYSLEAHVFTNSLDG